MKKLLIAVGIVSSILWICLLMNHIANEKLISNYEDGIYEMNDFTFLAFLSHILCTTIREISNIRIKTMKKQLRNIKKQSNATCQRIRNVLQESISL